MMQFRLPLSVLSPLCDTVMRFASKNSTLPILQNMYRDITDGVMTLKATDMEKYCLITTPVVAQGTGSWTVNAKLLVDILHACADGDIGIAYNADTETLIISSGKDTFSIKTLPASDYVALPTLTEAQHINISCSSLARGINKVGFACIEKSYTPIYGGIYLWTKTDDQGTNRLYFVGTDTQLLAEYSLTLDSTTSIKVSIPKSSALDIAHVAAGLVSDDIDPLSTLHVGSNLLGRETSIGQTTIYISTITIQGNFPDYHNPKIMPPTYRSSLLLETALFEKQLRKIDILAKDNKKHVFLSIDEGLLKLSTGKVDKGDSVAYVTCTQEGDIPHICLFTKHLADVCKIINGRMILGFNDETTPVKMLDPADPAFVAIARPIKV
ncbi:MAG: DNA polymerase III subunit beta [Candidatus Absconditabacterales bacterium]|nr:DNA polymerase III subunit beta [Candidatus Absconditabacterales bacterium]